MQPDDVQRIIAALEDASSSSDQASPSLSHIGLFGQPIFHSSPQTRDLKSISVSSFFRNYVQGEERTLLENISREEVRMSALKKGLKVSPTGSIPCSFCIRKKKSSPCGPHFPGTFRSMDNTRYPSDPSRARRPLRLAFPMNFGGSQHLPLRQRSFRQSLGPRPLIQIFHPYQGFCPAQHLDL